MASEAHPVRMALHTAEGRSAFAAFQAGPSAPQDVRDLRRGQLLELARIRNPSRSLSEEERWAYVEAEVLPPEGLDGYGSFVYFPWSKIGLKILEATDFDEVRTNRNRHKIDREEQAKLRRKTIGVVGLSVGHSIAVNLALEGIGGRFRLADFDHIELANMNRIPVPLTAIGENKAHVAARRMYEMDPYLEIEIFDEGLDDASLDAFLGGEDAPLDLLFEECDDFYTKIRVRDACRRRRIPVVMDTNDRGLLDIERFDLEPDRPLLHGLAPDVPLETLQSLSTAEKVPYVLKILDAEQMTATGLASLLEVGHSLTGWPQLATDTTLGAAICGHAGREILLGRSRASGRHYVDLSRILPSATPPPAAAPELAPSVARFQWHLEGGREASGPTGPLASDRRGRVEACATALAARAMTDVRGAEWVLRATAGDDEVVVDCQRATAPVGGLDATGALSAFALGAHLEQVFQALSKEDAGLGLKTSGATAQGSVGPSAVCLRWAGRPGAAPAQSELGAEAPAGAMRWCPSVADLSLSLRPVEDEVATAAVKAALSVVEQLVWLDPALYAGLVPELCRQLLPEAAPGLVVEPLPPPVLSILRQPRVLKVLRSRTAGRSLRELRSPAWASTAGFVAVVASEAHGDPWFAGGRAWARLVHPARPGQVQIFPCHTAVFLGETVRSGSDSIFGPACREQWSDAWTALETAFSVAGGERLVGIARVARRAEPARPS